MQDANDNKELYLSGYDTNTYQTVTVCHPLEQVSCTCHCPTAAADNDCLEWHLVEAAEITKLYTDYIYIIKGYNNS